MLRRAAGLAAVVVLAGLALPVTAANGCAARTSERTGVTGTWSSYQVPDFALGSDSISAHAVDGDRWLVTNGTVVLDSRDRGCTWNELLTLPATPTTEVPASRDTDRVRALAAAGGRVLATVELGTADLPDVIVVNEESPTDQPGTLVLTGTTSLAAGGPLTPPLGRPGDLVLAPSDGRTAYVVAGGRLHVSRDAGASWRPATPPSIGTRSDGATTTVDLEPPRVGDLAVAPHDALELWVQYATGVYGTSDGGDTWQTGAERLSEGTFSAVAVGSFRGSPPRVSAVEHLLEGFVTRGAAVGLYQGDGGPLDGRPFTARGLGEVSGTPQSLASSGPRADLVMTTLAAGATGSEVYYLLDDRLLRVDEFALSPLVDVLRGRDGAYAFRSDRRVHRWEPDRAGLRTVTLPARPPVTVGVGGIGAPLPPLSPETLLSSAVDAVQLAPGASEKVPLDLALGPEPTPVDVFFLLDTSTSMDDVVDGVAEGFAQLARDLGRRRIDAQFGLGDYQSYDAVRYRRLLDISPPGEPLRRALESITTSGGAEPAYTALHQMATGSGIEEPAQGQPVDPGLGASWRPGSLRVVVHATDEVLQKDPSGPDKDETIDALNADGVRHVGLHIVRDPLAEVTGDGSNTLFDPVALQKGLEELSRGTRTFAPPGGVDCNGDGTREVAGGAPLVCRFASNLLGGAIQLADPLVRLISTLKDEQDVTVAVSPADAARDFDVRVVANSVTRVDVKRSAALTYTLEVTCTSAAPGTTRDLQLRPRVGERTGVPLPLRVGCDPLPEGQRPVVLAPPPGAVAPQPPVLLALAPLPPIPPPAPAAAPAPAPAPAPGAAAVVNPVTGLAIAPSDQELQLVLVEQREQQEADELAMSAFDQRPDTGALRLASLLLVTAGAVALARRREGQAAAATLTARHRPTP
ncbi:MAG: VWA domain-containing protein [Mycobacteriales bacterium]|nr:VWA domain-containing protein [Mycobacteriales bacterium]